MAAANFSRDAFNNLRYTIEDAFTTRGDLIDLETVIENPPLSMEWNQEVRTGRLASELSTDSAFQHIVLRLFSHDELKLVIRHKIVSQRFRKQPVNSVTLSDRERHNLLMLLYL